MRRIDLEIGEKSYWGRGVGTAVIRLLTQFGFGHEGADMIFATDVATFNTRSIRAFGRAGYEIIRDAPEPPLRTCDLVYRRDDFVNDRAGSIQDTV